MIRLSSSLCCSSLSRCAWGRYEAWSKKRDVLGWNVNMINSVVGGALAADTVLDTPQLLHLYRPISAACMEASLLLGAWIALWIVNRFR